MKAFGPLQQTNETVDTHATVVEINEQSLVFVLTADDVRDTVDKCPNDLVDEVTEFMSCFNTVATHTPEVADAACLVDNEVSGSGSILSQTAAEKLQACCMRYRQIEEQLRMIRAWVETYTVDAHTAEIVDQSCFKPEPPTA